MAASKGIRVTVPPGCTCVACYPPRRVLLDTSGGRAPITGGPVFDLATGRPEMLDLLADELPMFDWSKMGAGS